MGIDPSLTCTGVAVRDEVFTITTQAKGIARLIRIRETINDVTLGVDLVAIEGYAYGAANNVAALGELGGVIRTALYQNDIPYVDIAPATLKKYALGIGRGSKTDIVVAARDRLGYAGTNDNEADALWLRAIAADLLGEPLVKLPKSHLDALNNTRKLYQ
jgi:crossover junction endodeoxyribonuclease RuvC